jgi:hypothetical protein
MVKVAQTMILLRVLKEQNWTDSPVTVCSRFPERSARLN